jgi:simple sugar transport system permease protein
LRTRGADTAIASQLITVAVTYALAAMCGAITERSGVIDFALEAKLLFGAFTAVAITHATRSPMLGVAGAAAAGMLVAAVQIGCTLGFGADQVVVSIALNIIALAGTRFLLQLIYHEGANSPQVPAFGGAVLANPIVWIAAVAVVAVPLALRRSRWGLRLRAAGDRPEALIAVGVSPTRTRLYAALVGGALCGAGGAQLSLNVGLFQADMSAGRGYMAVAMVILSGWRPAVAAAACVGIALAEVINIQFQLTPSDPRLLAWGITLAVVAWKGTGSPPKALGK